MNIDNITQRQFDFSMRREKITIIDYYDLRSSMMFSSGVIIAEHRRKVNSDCFMLMIRLYVSVQSLY